METKDFSKAVRGLYYRQRLFSDLHRLENEVKAFLIVNNLKKISVGSLRVELVKGQILITKSPIEDNRQLKLCSFWIADGP